MYKVGTIYKYSNETIKKLKWDATDFRMIVVNENGASICYDIKTNKVYYSSDLIQDIDYIKHVKTNLKVPKVLNCSKSFNESIDLIPNILGENIINAIKNIIKTEINFY